MKFKPKLITLIDIRGNFYLAFRLPVIDKITPEPKKGNKIHKKSRSRGQE